MQIPKKVKVGAKVYDVIKTENLKLGILNCSAEIDYKELAIRISESTPVKMEADFMHELIHALYDNLGYSDHDEKQVSELANALHALIEDNPGIFDNGNGMLTHPAP